MCHMAVGTTVTVTVTVWAEGAGSDGNRFREPCLTLGGGVLLTDCKIRFLFCLFLFFVLLQQLSQSSGRRQPRQRVRYISAMLLRHPGRTPPGSLFFFIFKMLLFCMMCMHVYRNFS